MTAFLADEHIPFRSIRSLREAGHDVMSISTDRPSITDLQVLKLAVADNRIIITCDRDFGDLIFHSQIPYKVGIIYFRLNKFRPNELAEIILHNLTESESFFDGQFTVVSRIRIRQKKL